VPHLIFLDIVLPGMNGFNALRVLRRDPLTRHIPIIMISGNEQATEEFYVHRIGADDFMKKPFARAEVFARIERLMDEDGTPAGSTSGHRDRLISPGKTEQLVNK
jgi:twitching motility two-component system response regulator PilH